MLRAQWNHRFADEDEILCNEDFRTRYLGSKSVAMRLLAELAVTTGRDPDEILDAIRDELIRYEAGRGLS